MTNHVINDGIIRTINKTCHSICTCSENNAAYVVWVMYDICSVVQVVFECSSSMQYVYVKHAMYLVRVD